MEHEKNLLKIKYRSSTGEIMEHENSVLSEHKQNRAIKIIAGSEVIGKASSNIINAVSGGAIVNIGEKDISFENGACSSSNSVVQNISGSKNIFSVSGDVSVSTGDMKKGVIHEEQAFERISAAFRMNLQQLEENIAQARKESSQFFKLTLVFSSLGFMVVLTAVALLLGGQTAAGIVSAIAGAIPEVTAALFFKKDRELRGSIEKYHQHLMDSQRILTMIDVAETVQSKEERDSIKREIICKALGIDANTVAENTPTANP